MEKHGKAILAMSGGTIFALFTLLINLFVNVSKDAQIAIDVAAQHGQELLEIRSEIALLRSDLRTQTADRYYRHDAERDFRVVERRLDKIERELDDE